ncbi:MAG: NifB/NifX family molybdenum-iron cluster-binding protein, partial [Desulfobacteraceae bacterium]
MKVAVPSDGPDLDARVGDRLGVSPYLLIIDLDSRAIEAHPNPGVSGSGSGMRMVALIISKKADFLLTRWCSPIAERHLSAYGVGIVTGTEGRVREALEKFEKGGLKMREEAPARGALTALNIDRRAVGQAVKSAFKQMSRLLPVVVGVIFLVGFFSAFLTQKMIASFFSGALWGDSLADAFIGSLFAGNPVT